MNRIELEGLSTAWLGRSVDKIELELLSRKPVRRYKRRTKGRVNENHKAEQVKRAMATFKI